MKRATFYVSFYFEDDPEHGGWGSLDDQYYFWIDLTDELYEELYHVWYDNDGHLNSWNTNWEGHDELYDTITDIATESLNNIMQKEDPEMGTFSQYDTLWELSKETKNAF